MAGLQLKLLFQLAKVKVKLSRTHLPYSVIFCSRTLPGYHGYSRGYSRKSSSSSDVYSSGYQGDETGEEMSELDDMADVLGRLSSRNRQDMSEFISDWKSDRRQGKKGIIKKKYFKAMQETSLLTWAAKEQIRFLHSQDPEIWSVEKLVDSFPASKEGILKILESTYKIRTEEELRRHDERVRKRWHAIVQTLPEKTLGGPIETDRMELKKIMDEQKLPLMLNAAGVKNLPAPKPQFTFDDIPRKRIGIFESIVDDYTKQLIQKDLNVKQLEKTSGIGYSQTSDEDLLQAIVRSRMPKTKEDERESGIRSIENRRTSERTDGTVTSKPTRRERRQTLQKDRSNCDIDVSSLEKYQLQDTRKQSN